MNDCVYGALESVAVLWRLRSYRDIIIIIIIIRRRSAGRLFHICGPATANDLSPRRVLVRCYGNRSGG